MSYRLYLAKHNATGKLLVGYTIKPTIAEGFAVRKYRGGKFNHLVREQGVEAFTLIPLVMVGGLPAARERLLYYVSRFRCFEPKGFNRKDDLNADGDREISRPWKHALGSKPWHRLNDDEPRIKSSRKSRDNTVTRYVRREIANGVTDYMTLLTGIIERLRNGSIEKKPVSWKIIHDILKQTLMEGVYRKQGYSTWWQVKSGAPAFHTLPAMAPDLGIQLGVQPWQTVDSSTPRRKRGRPPKPRPLFPEIKPPKRKRYLSPENKVKMIEGLKRCHRERAKGRTLQPIS